MFSVVKVLKRSKNNQSSKRKYNHAPRAQKFARVKGRFPFTKKFGKFPLGISVWEKRVPFVTSSIQGRPGRLIDRERHGTGDKDNKSVNVTQIFHWEVFNRKTGLPFQEFRLFRKISSGTNQKVVFHLQPDRNFRNFLVNGKRSHVRRVSSVCFSKRENGRFCTRERIIRRLLYIMLLLPH